MAAVSWSTVVSVTRSGCRWHIRSSPSRLARSAPGLRLVLDLAGLTWWDSSGLAALVIARQQVSGNPGARLVVAGLPGHLAQRLRDAGLDGQFTLARSTADAVDSFNLPG
jgi:anti-anti-sigma factor